jgi:hypothetical protein
VISHWIATGLGKLSRAFGRLPLTRATGAENTPAAFLRVGRGIQARHGCCRTRVRALDGARTVGVGKAIYSKKSASSRPTQRFLRNGHQLTDRCFGEVR